MFRASQPRFKGLSPERDAFLRLPSLHSRETQPSTTLRSVPRRFQEGVCLSLVSHGALSWAFLASTAETHSRVRPSGRCLSFTTYHFKKKKIKARASSFPTTIQRSLAKTPTFSWVFPSTAERETHTSAPLRSVPSSPLSSKNLASVFSSPNDDSKKVSISHSYHTALSPGPFIPLLTLQNPRTASAPHVVETCSQDADPPSTERRANLSKYVPRRLVRPHTNCATFFRREQQNFEGDHVQSSSCPHVRQED